MAESNFLVFNEENSPTRTFNDSEYLGASQRLHGVIPGIAISRQHNKMYYQWSSMCYALGQLLVQFGYDAYDYNNADITKNFKTILDGLEALANAAKTIANAAKNTADAAKSKADAAKAAVDAIDLTPYAKLNSPQFTGFPTAPTPGAGDSSTKIATTEFVATSVSAGKPDLSAYALIASPNFTGTPTAPTPSASNNSNQIATTAFVRQVAATAVSGATPSLTGYAKETDVKDWINALLPVGTIIPYSGSLGSLSAKWHVCDGTGGTPDLRDKFLMGQGKYGVGNMVEAGLPNITGKFPNDVISDDEFSGAFYHDSGMVHVADSAGGGTDQNASRSGFDASRCNNIYGKSDTVQPPAYAVYFIMKVA